MEEKMLNTDKKVIKNKPDQLIIIISMVVICCIIMSIVDAIIQPSYAVKSLIKIILFLGCPLMYSRFINDICLRKLFSFHKQSFFMSLFMGIGIFIVIISGYFLLRNILDLS